LSWEIFEERAHTYELWYETRRGRRAERAERAILEWLLAPFPAPRSLLEVGCGTGHFTRWLMTRNLTAIGLDRSPAMIAAARRLAPDLPLVIGDGHALPFRAGAFDLVAFIVTLEFLADAGRALVEAVRVARQGVVVLALNRWSLGALSRRHGRQRERPLLGQAHDYSICSLRTAVARATGHRLSELRWSCTVFPFCSGGRAPIPLGDVIGLAARLDG
jgi:ubiquinone/menaquinone biosynthesis C-methylase UbiE